MVTTAFLIYNAWNTDGCSDADSLLLFCSAGDVPNTPDEPGNDTTATTECSSDCWNTELLSISPLGSDCYTMELLVEIEGYCRHDLSHIIFGLDKAFVTNLSNSGNFRTEINSTDPKTGVYGIKIDDISGFGNEGFTEFTVRFDVCFTGDVASQGLPETIPVVYKAANCLYYHELVLRESEPEDAGVSVLAFPNPFSEEIGIRVSSSEDTNINIAIFDLKGNQVAQLFDGKIVAGIQYTFPFRINNHVSDRIFIYKITSNEKVVWGQILWQ